VKTLLLLALSACWPNQPAPTTVIREVVRYHVVHDVPRDCDGLPAFPDVSTLGDRTHFVTPYIAQLDAWIQAAGVCLYVHPYHIEHLVQEVYP
jgi:hypothetical protein